MVAEEGGPNLRSCYQSRAASGRSVLKKRALVNPEKVKGLSGLLFLGGISMFFNAAAGQWAFDFSKHETRYIVLDILIGFGCWIVSLFLWHVAEAREARGYGRAARADLYRVRVEPGEPAAETAAERVEPDEDDEVSERPSFR